MSNLKKLSQEFEEQRDGGRAYMLVDDLHWLAIKVGVYHNGGCAWDFIKY